MEEAPTQSGEQGRPVLRLEERAVVVGMQGSAHQDLDLMPDAAAVVEAGVM